MSIPPNQRRQRRRRSETACTVTVLGKTDYTVPATMVDFAENGIAILASEQIQPGSMVMLNYGGSSTIGEVRHCKSSPHGFRIGIEVDR